MEYLNKTINQAAAEKGSVAALETALDLPKKTLYEVKAGRRSLPIEACFKLAELTGADLVHVIAESEAITAKKPEKVEFWKKKLEALAACLTLAVVTNFVTPAPSEAAPLLKDGCKTLYIMLNAEAKTNSLTRLFCLFN